MLFCGSSLYNTCYQLKIRVSHEEFIYLSCAFPAFADRPYHKGLSPVHVSCGKDLVCLFGCGGDRDRTKRPEMAAVAEKWADRIFVTSDNSRTEKTEDIMADIRAGFSPAGLAKTVFIADRKEAIRAALMFSHDGSTVLLAGKGHETYQIIGKEKTHFDEREIVNEIFEQCSTTL